ncbi:tyrosine-type recombinase/integrase, partial [Trinickia diaoshuihuensis]|uniref:tyrosine-type recombinase/integrase n=1 Tax=Trinickia diaoshuihuensis TaxID=2292265 RepID=UPI0013C2BECA
EPQRCSFLPTSTGAYMPEIPGSFMPEGDTVFATSVNAVICVWKRPLQAAGTKDSELLTLRWHDLRHEAASRLFEKGLHPMEVASVTGHRSMQMLKRYTRLNPQSLLAKLG